MLENGFGLNCLFRRTLVDHMLNLENHYHNASVKCKAITEEVVKDTNAFVTSVKVLQEAISNVQLAVSSMTPTDPHMDPYVVDLSLPPSADILVKEMANLTYMLAELQCAIKTRLADTLRFINESLSSAVGQAPSIDDPSVLEAYDKYQQVLVRCISTLGQLEDDLFECTDLA